MSDEAAILAAIAAHPEEDTPRLAYADWLDEHGFPIRAEFIRVQCAVKPLETLPPEDQRPHVHLWRREQELVDNHRRDLLGPLGDDLTYFDVIFDRGFVTELNLDATRFLRHADAIAALKPLPAVCVRDGAAFLARLAVNPHAGVIISLRMQSDRRPTPLEISPDELEVVFSARRWDRLRELNLEYAAIGNAGLRILTASQNLPALTDLDLSGNGLTDDGVRELVRSPLWPRLKQLVLGGNPLSDDATEVLADAAAATRLTYLNLRFTAIGPDGHRRLLRQFGGKVDLF